MIDRRDRKILFEDAKKLVIEDGKASASYLQRHLRVGYSLAAQIIDLLEKSGVIGPQDGVKPRKVLIKSYESKGKNITVENDIFFQNDQNMPVEKDILFEDAKKIVIEKREASPSFLQKEMRIGYNRATRLIDQLDVYGVIGPEVCVKTREVLVDKYEPPIEVEKTNKEDLEDN